MTALSPAFRIAFLILAQLTWALPFAVKRLGNREEPVQTDPTARWGIACVMAGFFAVCEHGPKFWSSDLAVWRALAGAGFAIPSIILSWSAVSNLGRQWRVDAGLNRDHELVRTGAYRIIRHPIYASMLGMLLSVVCWAGTLPGWPIGIVLFILGTEIRVHVEDRLLRKRFGEEFTEWQRSVPAYLPFVR